MRWFVEIRLLGKSEVEPNRQCVEATQWQEVVQGVRRAAGLDEALQNFSIEVLADGIRAVDPTGRLRYTVEKAPDDAPLTSPEQDADTKPVKADSLTDAKPAPAARKQRDQTMVYGSPGSAKIAEAVGKTQGDIAPGKKSASLHPKQPPKTESQTAQQPPAALSNSPSTAMDSSSPFSILVKREESPSKASPLTYREYAYAIAEGSTEDEAEAFIVERFKEIREQLSKAQTAKLVNLAVFDHQFKGKPKRAPLVTLVWKDWKGDPEVRYTSRPGVSIPPPSLGKPTPSMPVPNDIGSTPPAKTAQPSSTIPEKDPSHLKEASATLGSTPPRAKVESHPPIKFASEPPQPVARGPRAASGDEIIADIFEAMHDLQFLTDAYEGADFVTSLATDRMNCTLGITQLYDINRREFVVAHARGPGFDKVLGNRTSDQNPLLVEIMTRKTPFVIDVTKDPRVNDGRWKNLGGNPRWILACAVAQGGRFLGILEIALESDESEFNQADMDGLAYIASSFAEFVASKGLSFGSKHSLIPS